MSASIVFWSGIIFAVFFVLSLLFKGMASAANALHESLYSVIPVVLGIVLILVILVAVGLFLQQAGKGAFGGFILIAITTVVFVILFRLLIALGGAVITIVAVILSGLLSILQTVCDFTGNACEGVCRNILEKISKQANEMKG